MLMPQQLLDRPNVGPPLQCVGSEGVPNVWLLTRLASPTRATAIFTAR